MRLRRHVKLTPRNGLFVFLVSVIIWNEYLALKFSSLFWITPNPSISSYSILLVSDPQLIGYRNEPTGIGWISRWDSDSYLKSGFEAAVATAQPKLIVFMGDLFDEGVQMSSQEFDWTFERFERIFSHGKKIPTVYLPGDNDIGGENEPVYDRLVKRFDRMFAHSLGHLDEFAKKHIDMASIIPIGGSYNSVIKAKDPRVKILISHIPLLRSVSRSDVEAIKNYGPDLILTAHDHTAEIYLRNRTSHHFQRYLFNKRLDFLISSKHPIIEIQNPTVSYRMGVPNMGYSVLTFYDENPVSAVFTVYWLPARYPQLYLYIFALIVLVYFFVRQWIYFSTQKLAELAMFKKRKNIV